ncbi:MAG: hypothetical protein D6812_15585 [Deltaproteobacteria bacterium]|nr:MAG: hypothetical protein D6812_15585 [Deltaproteobacteria bacterium]
MNVRVPDSGAIWFVEPRCPALAAWRIVTGWEAILREERYRRDTPSLLAVYHNDLKRSRYSAKEERHPS